MRTALGPQVDGGFLPSPVRLTALTIAPAERFDVIMDFSDTEGRIFVMTATTPGLPSRMATNRSHGRDAVQGHQPPARA